MPKTLSLAKIKMCEKRLFFFHQSARFSVDSGNSAIPTGNTGRLWQESTEILDLPDFGVIQRERELRASNHVRRRPNVT